ncbi:NTP transferase domain-containing protein [Candidatus Babeliales bacterium]|nr:NTP transferase domain-containing protein [Candidatus Babeliales bacterium]
MRQLINAVVLAAGKSKRFRGQVSKIVTKICGREMIVYPLTTLAQLELDTTVVVGKLATNISDIVSRHNIKNVNFAHQKEALGTGHAASCSRPFWEKPHVLVINGDTPLITKDLIEELAHTHISTDAAVSIVTSFVTEPASYGRVIEDKAGIRIIEAKDCSLQQKKINKINAGMYLFKKEFLEKYIDSLETQNAAGEFYLTDLIKIANDNNLKINLVSRSYDEVRGINNLEELWAVEQIKRSEIMRNLMLSGVRFELAQTIHVDVDVQIGDGSFIGNGALLLGKTKIGQNCKVLASSIVENSTIGNDTVIHSHSIVKNSSVGNKCEVGPFANVKEHSKLQDNSTVVSFSEIKNSIPHTRNKSNHKKRQVSA